MKRRVKRLEKKGTPERPRLSVYRSLKHIYAQIIDDISQKTLVSASSKSLKLKAGGNKKASEEVGKSIAKAALEKGIKKVFFDRGKFLYHGRVAVLADAARKEGLEF